MFSSSPLHAYLEQLHNRFRTLNEGEVANYIPELSKANPEHFGIVLVTTDGQVYAVGQTETEFTIQSISKAFVYAIALADRGSEAVLQKVYVEPTGDAFNSISLHPDTGAPLNPMINAGAIATTGLVNGDTPAEQWQRIIGTLSDFAGRPLSVDETVYQSEANTGFRNRAIGWMLRNSEIIDRDPTQIIENYFRQCSILVSCRDLGIMGATLANGGINPLTGQRALPADKVCPTLSVMSTCGMYDYAGSWMFEVGLPVKSGVGGGIVAVLPGRFAVATFSPRLDSKGNSVRGIEVCKALSKDLGLHMMGTLRNTSQVISREYSRAEVTSNRMRSASSMQYLADQGRRISVLTLQGDIALDGAERISRRLIRDAGLSYAVLDMCRVALISPPAAKLIIDTIRHLRQRGGDLAFARISKSEYDIETTLRQALEHDAEEFHLFPDTDRAMEWCENKLLSASNHVDEGSSVPTLSDFALFSGLEASDCNALSGLLQEFSYSNGTVIVNAGACHDTRIFLLLSGEVSVLVTVNQDQTQRLATLGPGMSFGEVVILGQTYRTATVLADSNVKCWVLQATDLDRLADTRPKMKITILNNLAVLLAEKLKQANGMVAVLAK